MAWIECLHGDVINSDAICSIDIDHSQDDDGYFINAALINGEKKILTHIIINFSNARIIQRELMSVLITKPIITNKNIDEIIKIYEA